MLAERDCTPVDTLVDEHTQRLRRMARPGAAARIYPVMRRGVRAHWGAAPAADAAAAASDRRARGGEPSGTRCRRLLPWAAPALNPPSGWACPAHTPPRRCQPRAETDAVCHPSHCREAANRRSMPCSNTRGHIVEQPLVMRGSRCECRVLQRDCSMSGRMTLLSWLTVANGNVGSAFKALKAASGA